MSPNSARAGRSPQSRLWLALTLLALVCCASAAQAAPPHRHREDSNVTRVASLVAAPPAYTDAALVDLLVGKDTADQQQWSPTAELEFLVANEELRMEFANLTTRHNGTLLGAYVEHLVAPSETPTPFPYSRPQRSLCAPPPEEEEEDDEDEPEGYCRVFDAPPPRHGPHGPHGHHGPRRHHNNQRKDHEQLIEPRISNEGPEETLMSGHFVRPPRSSSSSQSAPEESAKQRTILVETPHYYVPVKGLEHPHHPEGDHHGPRRHHNNHSSVEMYNATVDPIPDDVMTIQTVEPLEQHREGCSKRPPPPRPASHAMEMLVRALRREARFARKTSESQHSDVLYVPVIRVSVPPPHSPPKPEESASSLHMDPAQLLSLGEHHRNVTLPPVVAELWHVSPPATAVLPEEEGIEMPHRKRHGPPHHPHGPVEVVRVRALADVITSAEREVLDHSFINEPPVPEWLCRFAVCLGFSLLVAGLVVGALRCCCCRTHRNLVQAVVEDGMDVEESTKLVETVVAV